MFYILSLSVFSDPGSEAASLVVLWSCKKSPGPFTSVSSLGRPQSTVLIVKESCPANSHFIPNIMMINKVVLNISKLLF